MKFFTHTVFLVFLSIIMLIATDSWAAKPYCGDGVCKGKETYDSCQEDCFFCGDGTCNPGEDSDSCQDDCPIVSICGDNRCDPGEDCSADCSTSPPESISFLLEEEVLSAHHGDPVRAVDFANYGTGQVVSGGEDEYLIVRDLLLPEDGLEIPLSHIIYDLDSSDDGSIIVTGVGGWSGGTDVETLRTFDAINGYSLIAQTRAPIGYVYSVAISPNNDWTVASGFYGDIVVYNTFDMTMPHVTKETKKKRTKALAFSPDGNILASTSTAGIIQLWSFPELNLLPVSLRHSGSWAFPIAFYPKDDLGEDKIKIASSTDSGVIKVWTIVGTSTNPRVDSVISIDSGSVYCLDWSSDGKMIAAGGNGIITVYNADTLEILQVVDAHASRVNDVAFSSDNSMLVSGGRDGALKLWVSK